MKNANNNSLFPIGVLSLLLAAGTFLPSAIAKADEPNAAEWVPVRHLSFGVDDVEGTIEGPGGEQIESVVRATHSSLIELREGFEVEIVKSMEDL
jgi:hypothetical protein